MLLQPPWRTKSLRRSSASFLLTFHYPYFYPAYPPLITEFSIKEPLINVCEAVSAAKVAALGEAKISEPKRSEDGTRQGEQL